MEKIILVLFFAYLALFPFGQLTKLPLQLIKVPEIHLYLTDLVVAGLVGCWFGWRLAKREKFVLPPLTKPILFFILVAGVSLLFNTPLLTDREVVVSGLYLLRWIFYAGLYFVIFDLQKHFNQLKWHSLSRFLLMVGVTVAIFGLIQYVLWPDLKPLEILGWDPHYYRVVSTFLDPGFTGIILVLSLILLFLTSEEVDFTTTIRGVFLFVVLYLALALTYSRASYLAYVVGMGVISWMKKMPKLFVGVILLGALTLVILPQPVGEGGKLGRTYSLEARIENWQHALIISRDHPILGIGFNAYRYAQRDYGFLEEEKWQASHSGAGADSSLLFVLATTGILGLLGYLGIWGKAVTETKRADGMIVLASIAALFVHSLFLNSLFYPWVMAWMWILKARECK